MISINPGFKRFRSCAQVFFCSSSSSSSLSIRFRFGTMDLAFASPFEELSDHSALESCDILGSLLARIISVYLLSRMNHMFFSRRLTTAIHCRIGMVGCYWEFCFGNLCSISEDLSTASAALLDFDIHAPDENTWRCYVMGLRRQPSALTLLFVCSPGRNSNIAGDLALGMHFDSENS
jgi:hypothetical protein